MRGMEWGGLSSVLLYLWRVEFSSLCFSQQGKSVNHSAKFARTSPLNSTFYKDIPLGFGDEGTD